MEYLFLVSKFDIGISAWENRMTGKAGIFLRQFEEHLGVNVIIFFFLSLTRNQQLFKKNWAEGDLING